MSVKIFNLPYLNITSVGQAVEKKIVTVRPKQI